MCAARTTTLPVPNGMNGTTSREAKESSHFFPLRVPSPAKLLRLERWEIMAAAAHHCLRNITTTLDSTRGAEKLIASFGSTWREIGVSWTSHSKLKINFSVSSQLVKFTFFPPPPRRVDREAIFRHSAVASRFNKNKLLIWVIICHLLMHQ